MKTNQEVETEFSHDQQGYILDLHNEIEKKDKTIVSLFFAVYIVGFWAACVTLCLIFKP
jgi:hypothetical protein